MNYIFLIFIIFFFIKAWFYGLYELETQKNKVAANAIFIIDILSFIFAAMSLCYFIVK